MNKIEWLTNTYLTVGDYQIPCVANLTEGYHQGAGIKRSSKSKLIVKRTLWPLWKMYTDLLIDGFIEREVGKLIEEYRDHSSVFMEIGCGDMSLRKLVPHGSWYNGLDLQLSDFQLMRVLHDADNVNVVVASAADIPVPSETASLIVSTETFEHIPEIGKTLQEIHRIAVPGAILICSIPNNYCNKYIKKGPHPGHINNWTYEEFVSLMQSCHFDLVKGYMKGKWVPLPLWLTKTSYQFPLSSKAEYYNTNFFYVFSVNK